MKTTKFKMTELGPIPVDWEVKRLGECCARIKNGFTYSVCNRGAYKISRIETISKGVVNYSRVGYVKDAPPAEYMLSNGDILFSHINSLPYIGNVALYDGKELLYHGMNLLLLRCNERANANYLYYALSSAPMRSRARELAKIAINQASISIGDLSRSEIPLPPLAEQRRIAGALSDVDELILALGKLIEKKRNIKTGAMQELLTGKIRLPGFGAARAEFKQTELGPIPVDWEVKRLGEVCEVYDGTHQTPHYVDNGIQFYSVENVTANDFTNVKHISEEEHVALSKRAKIERGDILMTRIGSIGVCRYINWDVEASYYVSLALLKKKQDAQVNMCFLACASESEWFKDEVWLRSLQFAIPLKINLGKISEIRLYLPPLAEQKAIAAVLSDIDAEIAALEADRAKYERIKSGMMQELLTGRTRLKGE